MLLSIETYAGRTSTVSIFFVTIQLPSLLGKAKSIPSRFSRRDNPRCRQQFHACCMVTFFFIPSETRQHKLCLIQKDLVASTYKERMLHSER